MRRLRITIVDLTTERPTNGVYARIMNANLASIMPQVAAVWCEELGHQVNYVTFTGFEDLSAEVRAPADVLIVCSFTQAAHVAYAISALHRQRGGVTIMGGPHARAYPEDAARYFDYVLGFTDKQLLGEVLQENAPSRPMGQSLSAAKQPATLPGVRERWKFIAATIAKAPMIKIVPMIGSLGCPYTCSFCIDSVVPYQPLGFDQIRDDLKFLLTVQKRPRVGWHDPNFGVRFDDYLNAIEDVVPPNRIDFIAESSLSLLSEPHLKRLQHNGFKALLPGIESWFSLSGKSKTGGASGMEKVKQVAAHVNMIMRYVPYVQTNFVLGLDGESGPEPFELTKRFLDLAPGAFPAFSLLTSFGRSAPLNLEFQRAGRVIPFPFHFLDASQAMNVRPQSYQWGEFYDRLLDVEAHAYSIPVVARRWRAGGGMIPRVLNVARAFSSERNGRVRQHAVVRARIAHDPTVRRFLEGETTTVPAVYTQQIQSDLGALWPYLPPGGMLHDPNAYLKSERKTVPQERPIRIAR